MTVQLQSEITKLSEALDLDLPDTWHDPVQRYLPAMKKYLEYQISLSKKELALITLGRDDTFLDHIEDHLDELGVGSRAISIFRMMRNQVTRATWGVKQALGPTPELQLYIKKPLPLDRVLSELQAQGLKSAAAEQIKAVAAHLEKPHTHFFGADFTPGKLIPYQIYFTQYITNDDVVINRLRRIVDELQLPAHVHEQLVQTYDLLAYPDRTVWVSLSLSEGNIYPSLKLDYSAIPFNSVANLLEVLRFSEQPYNYLRAVAETLRVRTADYLGLRLTANAAPNLSVYLTRIK